MWLIASDCKGPVCQVKAFVNIVRKDLETCFFLKREPFHASLGVGRYALGLLWFKLFTGKSTLSNGFSVFDEPVSERDLEIAHKCVESLSFEM